MARASSKHTPIVVPARKSGRRLCRVSSKEQEKEGFSIPAQLKMLREYAAAQGFVVAQEYMDVETAKQTGRAAFGEMGAEMRELRRLMRELREKQRHVLELVK